jgi:hypothetical protein
MKTFIAFTNHTCFFTSKSKQLTLRTALVASDAECPTASLVLFYNITVHCLFFVSSCGSRVALADRYVKKE